MSDDNDEVMNDDELSHRDLDTQHDQEKFEAVALGHEAKLFLTSDLAQYITDSAEIKVIDALDALSQVDPTDTKEIIRLQGIIQQFGHYDRCLKEIVATGDSVYQEYLQGHHEE